MKIKTQKISFAATGIQTIILPGNLYSLSIQAANGYAYLLDEDDLDTATAYPLSPDITHTINTPKMAGTPLRIYATSGIAVHLFMITH